MTDQTSGTRLAAILWFVAAALAFMAAGVSFLPPRDFNWSVPAGGLFSLAMGCFSLEPQSVRATEPVAFVACLTEPRPCKAMNVSKCHWPRARNDSVAAIASSRSFQAACGVRVITAGTDHGLGGMITTATTITTNVPKAGSATWHLQDLRRFWLGFVLSLWRTDTLASG